MKRPERMQEIQGYLGVARGQLDLIENSFQLIADQIVTMQSPQELSGQLDELLEGVEAIRESARDTEALLDRRASASRDRAPLDRPWCESRPEEPPWPTPASCPPGPKTSAAATCANEAVLFVLHGNVHDLVLDDGAAAAADRVPHRDVLEGRPRHDRRLQPGDRRPLHEEGEGGRGPGRAPPRDAGRTRRSPALERLLSRLGKVGVVVEYAETLAPAGDPSFQGDADRASHRHPPPLVVPAGDREARQRRPPRSPRT